MRLQKQVEVITLKEEKGTNREGMGDYLDLTRCKNCVSCELKDGKPYCNLFFKETQMEYHCASFQERKEQLAISLHQQKNFSDALYLITNKLSLAEKFVQKQPLFYDKTKLWWFWSNESLCWKKVDEIDILNMIAKSEGADTINQKERNEIIQALKQVGRLHIPKEPKKTWVQFDSMIVDIETYERVFPTKDYFITNTIPWSLGINEETPILDKIFREWVGEEYLPTLYEIIAYAALPDYPIHRIFCFLGEGANGKSKFLELIRRFVGRDNVVSTELDLLTTSRFEPAKLYKKLACMMGETDMNELRKTNILKWLTGEDMIPFEFKNKNPFDGYNYAKILIATNNLPETTDKTKGYYRRWLIIDFPNIFTEGKDILAEIPDEEYKHLALKSIKILHNLLQVRRFHNEGSIEDREKRYEDRSNPFDKFWKDTIQEDAGSESYITKNEFRKMLNEWCHENHFRQMSDKTVARHMKEKGIECLRVPSPWYMQNIPNKPDYMRVWMGITMKGENGKAR